MLFSHMCSIVQIAKSDLKEREKRENPREGWRPGGFFFAKFKAGSVLLSQKVTQLVPSALEGLTSVFGMETGVAPPL